MMKVSRATLSALALFLFAAEASLADDDRIEVKNIDDIIRNNRLPADGPTASIVAFIRAGGSEIGVLVMSKNRLHHHAAQDHVLYLVRGQGTAKLETANGEVETRSIKPGDIFSLPRGRKHGFEKSGAEDLVFLVVATQLPPGVEETTYHE